jgi:hypothetical protein
MGRELDARVAALFFGWTEVREARGTLTGVPPGRTAREEVPRFSSRWTSAARLLDALRARSFDVAISAAGTPPGEDGPREVFHVSVMPLGEADEIAFESGRSLPRTLARVAVAAVEQRPRGS